MPVFIFPSEYLNPVTDSLSTQKIFYREITETNPLTGFSDSVTIAKVHTVNLATTLLSSSYSVSANTPVSTRNLTETFTTRDVINPQWKVTAYFLYSFNTPVSAFFIGTGELDTPVQSYFQYTTSYPVSAHFTTPNYFDIGVKATLGTLNKDFKINANYVVSATNDFPVRIIIQSQNSYFKANYGTYEDFNAQIKIVSVGSTNFKTTANFRVPPLHVDYTVNALFANDTFIYVTNLSTNELYTCKVDTDGFWHIDGLVAGPYSIQPMLGNATFNPSIQYYTITDASPTLYFTQIGGYNISSNFSNNVSNQLAAPCTFSIQGFILPDQSVSFNQVLAVIVDDDLATQFKQTINYSPLNQ